MAVGGNRTPLIHQHFEMYRTETSLAIVDDILGPDFALNVDQNSGFRFLELESDNWTQIARNVFVGEIVGGETLEWCVRHVANVLPIGRVFTFARHPDHVHLVLILGVLGLDVFFEVGGHQFGQIVGIVVGFGNPSEDAVQFEHDARPSAFVAERLLLGALVAEQFDVKGAHLVLRRRFLEAAAGKVLTAAGHRVVRFKKLLQRRGPVFPVAAGSVFEVDQRALDVLVAGHGPESETWIGADEAVGVLPPGLVEIESLEEDEQHSGKEGSQKGVQDNVKRQDFRPTTAGSSKKFAGLSIPEENFETLPAGSFWRGCTEMIVSFLFRHFSLFVVDVVV